MSERRQYLSLFAESGSEKELGGLPNVSRFHLDVSDFAQEQEAVKAWLVYGQTDPTIIREVARKLPGSLENNEAVFVFFNQHVLPDEREGGVDGRASVYDCVVTAICAEILNDISRGKGKKIRRIIRRIDEQLVSQILGNEDLRDFLEIRKRNGGIDIEDIQRAASAACILYMATVWVDWVQTAGMQNLV